MKTTNESYQKMNGILTQIGDALAIPRHQLGNRHIIQEIPMQEWLNNNNNPENIKNMNKEDFWHQAQVHFNNYKKEVKPRRKDTTPET